MKEIFLKIEIILNTCFVSVEIYVIYIQMVAVFFNEISKAFGSYIAASYNYDGYFISHFSCAVA